MLVTDIRLIEQRKSLYRQHLLGDYKKQGIEKPVYTSEPVSCRVDKGESSYKPQFSFNISKNVSIGEIHSIPESVKHGLYFKLSNWYLSNISAIYKVVENKGVNCADSRVRDIDVCLAKYSQKVAQEMDVSSACYTGVKHALWSSGVLNDYSDMPRGSAHVATEYFDAHPEKFERIDVKLKDLNKLPAGYIVVYKRDGFDGHIAITNGYGQETSDCTDNMKWVQKQKGQATFDVYKLTDGWKYNSATKKLEFKQQ